jgi:aryl-alcohol dehydrogenase-like predicted oxidoreductase
VLTPRQLNNPLFSAEHYATNLKKIEVLKDIANKHQVNTSQVALAWLLTRDFVSAIIPGAKSVEQMLTNIQSDQLILQPEEIQLIDQTFNKTVNL